MSGPQQKTSLISPSSAVYRKQEPAKVFGNMKLGRHGRTEADPRCSSFCNMYGVGNHCHRRLGRSLFVAISQERAAIIFSISKQHRWPELKGCDRISRRGAKTAEKSEICSRCQASPCPRASARAYLVFCKTRESSKPRPPKRAVTCGSFLRCDRALVAHGKAGAGEEVLGTIV